MDDLQDGRPEEDPGDELLEDRRLASRYAVSPRSLAATRAVARTSRKRPDSAPASNARIVCRFQSIFAPAGLLV